MAPLIAVAVLASVRIGGYVVGWNPTSVASYEAHAKAMDCVSAQWISLDDDGTPNRSDEAEPEFRDAVRKIAKKNHNRLFALAANSSDGTFDAKRVEAFLASKETRAIHIQDLTTIVKEDGLDGIEVDYESLQTPDKDDFSAFIDELAASIHKSGKLLVVALHPKTGDEGDWDGPAAQDYERIGKSADIVRIMAYDYSWLNSPAGPISPDSWTESVMQYAASKIAPAKLEIGIAGYGYDWSATPPRSLTWTDWQTIEGDATEDPLSGELVKGDAHYSSASSNRRKIELAAKLGLRGVALWYVGCEDPDLWAKR